MSAQRWTLQDRLNYHASRDRAGRVRAVATSEADKITIGQQGKLWAVDDGDCQRIFGCHFLEITRAAASALIEYLNNK